MEERGPYTLSPPVEIAFKALARKAAAETAPATPREEFAQASQQLAQAQARLDADRRHFNDQRRQVGRAFPYAAQVAERDARLEEALGALPWWARPSTCARRNTTR